MDERSHHTTISSTIGLPSPLLQLLYNPLILYQIVPYLPIHSLLRLGAVSKDFKALIFETPHVFRYLRLSETKSAQSEIGSIDHGGEIWRNVQLDESLTEPNFNSFYGGPLRGIFNNLRKRNILRDVQTLILDGLSVPFDLVSEIILDDSYNVRLLSIREVQHLNEAKLMQALKYACRSSRAPNTPRLQGLYIFGRKEPPQVERLKRHINMYPPGIAPIDTIPNYGVMSAQGAQIGAQQQGSGTELAENSSLDGSWNPKRGNVFSEPISEEWAYTILACQGIINFDVTLCNGPRHSAGKTADKQTWYRQAEHFIPPRAATHVLDCCTTCGTCPEGVPVFGKTPLCQFPLLAPPPLHVSTIKAAKTPFDNNFASERKFMVRCTDCLQRRYCQSCMKWWCEDCYEATEPVHSPTLPESTSDSETIKVHMGLCVEICLVAEMMSGAGSNGIATSVSRKLNSDARYAAVVTAPRITKVPR
ncbi:Ubiquitin fusion degradation protein [Rutstroemia sp. NJR-2017a WRK4]|nr:Ubiquitin fusion degradation protein [Rutstroemia sp. NJR-2017a WRK4]